MKKHILVCGILLAVILCVSSVTVMAITSQSDSSADVSDTDEMEKQADTAPVQEKVEETASWEEEDAKKQLSMNEKFQKYHRVWKNPSSVTEEDAEIIITERVEKTSYPTAEEIIKFAEKTCYYEEVAEKFGGADARTPGDLSSGLDSYSFFHTAEGGDVRIHVYMQLGTRYVDGEKVDTVCLIITDIEYIEPVSE